MKRLCTAVMVAIAESWIRVNGWGLALLHKIQWDIRGLEDLRLDRSYLVCANHQSWVDIVALQKVFNRRIPFLRFFLKNELRYVPLLGLAWWALDFPFMKRYSKAYLERHPEKRGQDLETTRKACARLKDSNISILNFLEGTRFTPSKHAAQNSTYTNLLMPKTGGVAFVLDAMGEQFDRFVDVTIYYPDGSRNLWNFLSGRVRHIVVYVETRPIPRELLHGNYQEDAEFRDRMQAWIRHIWESKDEVIAKLKTEAPPARSSL